MQYVMLIYLDSQRWSEISRDERNRIHADCGAWHEEIVRSGHTRLAMGLQPVTTATTLRDTGEKITVTDGPFAETKEVLGGLEVLECENLDQALAIAKRFPGLRAGGSVELRPLVPGNECKD
jgi:hypothetical protein